jgi:hypothetical protein
MMSVSQVDMVVWADTDRELQVCGDLSLMAVAGNVPSSTDPQSFTVVVRQGDNVATLHKAAPFDRETFDPENGRWELKNTLEPQNQTQFQRGKPAVVSAVIILKCEPAGLETLSWVQPVDKIRSGRTSVPEQLEFRPEVVAQASKRTLNKSKHSVSSSLAILHEAAGDGTFKSLQRMDEIHQPDRGST